MVKLITHSKPWITGDDHAAIEELLSTNMLAQGRLVREFEQRTSDWVCAKDGVAVGSGAAALVLALLTLKVKEGDEVLIPSYVCTSVLDAVLFVGVRPIICDVGKNWVVEDINIEKLVTEKTKALILPHMYGIFLDVTSFKRFAIPIIEDCAQALDDKHKRSIQGDLAILSFHPTKCLTTGEGGMVVSNNTNLLNKARLIRDGGINNCNGRFFSPMSDMSAALGISQLNRYSEAIRRRKMFAQDYIECLQRYIPESLNKDALNNSMYFRFPIRVSGGILRFNELFEKENICVRRGVDKLLHRIMNLDDNYYKNSTEHYDTTLSLPIYPAMTDAEHQQCLDAIKKIFKEALNKWSLRGTK